MSENERTTTRDVPATLVPYGEEIVIPAETKVMITHRLGGNFTVTWDNYMAQIKGEEADAIGEEKKENFQKDSSHSGPPDKNHLWEALKTVYDPEIPVNIVDLGLVYNLQVEEQETTKYKVSMDMTLTAPGCGMGPAIAADAKYRLEGVPGVDEADVEIVWDPPWTQDMISEDGKMELGLI